MPNTAFAISGHIVFTSIYGATQVFRAGDAFAESVGNEHRGYTELEAAEIVCTYAGAGGEPLSVPTRKLGVPEVVASGIDQARQDVVFEARA